MTKFSDSILSSPSSVLHAVNRHGKHFSPLLFHLIWHLREGGNRTGRGLGDHLLRCGRTFAARYLLISSMFLAVGALHNGPLGPLGAFRNFTLISLLVYPQTGHCVLPSVTCKCDFNCRQKCRSKTTVDLHGLYAVSIGSLH